MTQDGGAVCLETEALGITETAEAVHVVRVVTDGSGRNVYVRPSASV